MEKTYKHTITTMDGKDKTITMKHLTPRDIVRMIDNPALLGVESLIDIVTPGTLDIVDPGCILGIIELIEEKDKSFFVQMTKMTDQLIQKSVKSAKKSKKSK